MRSFARRFWIGVPALLVGMVTMNTIAVADVSDDEFKVLLAQDLKALEKAVALYEKAATDKDKKSAVAKSANSVRSTAFYIAYYTNSRVAGKDGANMAAIRDAAIKIAQGAAEKDYKNLAANVKAMQSPKDGKAEKIDVMKAMDKVSVDDTMYNFKKLASYGSGAEEAIKANSKKATATPVESAAIAQRVLMMAEMSKSVNGGSNDADKKEWASITDELEKAGKDLLAAAKGKKSAADMAKSFLQVDAACTKCHNKFKN